MASPLATLGQFRLGTTEYAAGRARTTGEWHLVRKQYGDDSSTYSYARFTDRAAYLAARAAPDAYPYWQDEPFSTIDYSLLLLPMATPLPASSASAGALPATSAGGGDSTALAQAITAMAHEQPARNADNSMTLRTPDSGAALLVEVKRGTGPTTLAANAATETTLAQVLAQLLGTLSVGVNGAVSIANPSLAVTGTFWPTMQPVSGPLTDLQLRAAPVPVSVSFPTTQAVSLATAPLAAGASTAALQTALNSTVAVASKQDTGNAALAAIQVSTAAAPTAAQQAQANTYLQTIASGLTATVVAGSALPYSLVSAAGNNPTSVRAGATQLLGLTATNASSSYRYVMLYNLVTAPATGATPLLTLGVPPGQSVSLPIASGKYVAFSVGLGLAISSTAVLATIVGGLLGTTGVSANEVVVNATYA